MQKKKKNTPIPFAAKRRVDNILHGNGLQDYSGMSWDFRQWVIIDLFSREQFQDKSLPAQITDLRAAIGVDDFAWTKAFNNQLPAIKIGIMNFLSKNKNPKTEEVFAFLSACCQLHQQDKYHAIVLSAPAPNNPQSNKEIQDMIENMPDNPYAQKVLELLKSLYNSPSVNKMVLGDFPEANSIPESITAPESAPEDEFALQLTSATKIEISETPIDTIKPISALHDSETHQKTISDFINYHKDNEALRNLGFNPPPKHKIFVIGSADTNLRAEAAQIVARKLMDDGMVPSQPAITTFNNFTMEILEDVLMMCEDNMLIIDGMKSFDDLQALNGFLSAMDDQPLVILTCDTEGARILSHNISAVIKLPNYDVAPLINQWGASAQEIGLHFTPAATEKIEAVLRQVTMETTQLSEGKEQTSFLMQKTWDHAMSSLIKNPKKNIGLYDIPTIKGDFVKNPKP